VRETSTALLLTFTEAYSEPGTVAVDSALRHASTDTTVTVGTVDLSEPSARRLRRVAKRHGVDLTIRDLADLAAPFPKVGRYPPLAWTRTVAAEILPAGTPRAVYLDADVIVRSEIAPLANCDLGSAGVAAVADPEMPTHGHRGEDYTRAVGSSPRSPYFNSGVLVIDLHVWDAIGVKDRVLELLRKRIVPIDYIDQDVLNAVFTDRWCGLPATWNTPADDSAIDPSIVQFPSGIKPWDAMATGRFVEEYRRLAGALASL
jgi:lipopolysaccharide biosynthesis glycosyltransferase